MITTMSKISGNLWFISQDFEPSTCVGQVDWLETARDSQCLTMPIVSSIFVDLAQQVGRLNWEFPQMFGWFTPSCPIELRDKVWVEQRLPWLFERFGTQRILSLPRVLPTREFFPESYLGSPDDLPTLLGRICQYMGADSGRFELSLFSEDEQPNALGLYQKEEGDRPRIWLKETLLPDQEAVIATLSHEVAHDLLLGAGLVSGDEPDHEHLTDLLPVVLGMGTFHANTAIKQDSWNAGNMSYWTIRRSGYLTASVCGYAMGVIEWLRGSTSPPSVAYLGADAAGAMRSGHRYLLKTADCLIDRNRPERLMATLTAEPLELIANGSSSQCLFILAGWLTNETLTSAQIDAALKSLRRKEPVIQSTAIEVLEKVDPPSNLVIDSILELLHSPHDSVRARATMATTVLRLPLEHVLIEGNRLLDELMWLIKGPDPETALAAAVVFGSHGNSAIKAVPNILSLLVAALTRHSDSTDALFHALWQIVGNVKAYLDEHPGMLMEGQNQLIREGLRSWQVPNGGEAATKPG